jgi:hypothetical protein
MCISTKPSKPEPHTPTTWRRPFETSLSGPNPGRGDVDLLAALDTLPSTFAGWVIVEVDVPEAPTNLESTQLSAAWVTEQLGADVFEAAAGS